MGAAEDAKQIFDGKRPSMISGSRKDARRSLTIRNLPTRFVAQVGTIAGVNLPNAVLYRNPI